MRPPSAADHRPAKRLRVLYIQKHAPYNAGEERVVEESVARKLCVMGVAVPSSSKGPGDEFGGWGLTPDQAKVREQLDAERQAQAGDFAEEQAIDRKATEAETKRVEAEAAKGKGKGTKADANAKNGGFAKGKKGEAAGTAGDSDGDAAAAV